MAISLGTLAATITANAQGFLTEITKSDKAVSQFEKSITKSVMQAGNSVVGLTAIANAVRKEFQYVYENVEKIKGIDPQVVADIQAMRGAIIETKLAIDQLVGATIGNFATAAKSIGLFAGGVREALGKMRLGDFGSFWQLAAAVKRTYKDATDAVTQALSDEYEAANKAAQAQNNLALATSKLNQIKEQQAETFKKVNQALDAFFGEMDKKSKSTFEGWLGTLKESVKTVKELSAEAKKIPDFSGVGGQTPADSFMRRGLAASTGSSSSTLNRQVDLLRDQVRLLSEISRNTAGAQVAAFA